MAENTKPSPNQKPESSWAPGPLTPQEIELLRQDRKECHLHSLEFFRAHGVKQLYNLPKKK